MTVVTVKTASADEVEIDFAEAARYLGYKSLTDEALALLKDCAERFSPTYRACYARFSKEKFAFEGELNEMLSGCSEVLLFAATAGVEADRLVKRYMDVSPAKAVAADALGTAAIEAWCDRLFKNEAFTERYSPGYGSLPIEFQKTIFKELNCEKNAGIYLTESLTMLPMKSVSGVVGIGGKSGCKSGCGACRLTGCAFRKTGE